MNTSVSNVSPCIALANSGSVNKSLPSALENIPFKSKLYGCLTVIGTTPLAPLILFLSKNHQILFGF